MCTLHSQTADQNREVASLGAREGEGERARARPESERESETARGIERARERERESARARESKEEGLVAQVSVVRHWVSLTVPLAHQQSRERQTRDLQIR